MFPLTEKTRLRKTPTFMAELLLTWADDKTSITCGSAPLKMNISLNSIEAEVDNL